MGIAALIIGIVAVILGLIPACGLIFGLPPAIVGLILAIVEISRKSKKNEPKGLGMGGLILNIVAIVIIVIWTVIIAATADDAKLRLEEMATEMEQAAGQMATEMEQAADDMATEMEKTDEGAGQ